MLQAVDFTKHSNDLPFKLGFLSLPKISAALYLQTRRKFPDFREVYQLSSGQLIDLGLTEAQICGIKKPNWPEIEGTLSWLERPQCEVLFIDDEAYPALLKEIANPPRFLFVQGNREVLYEPQVAMVGSRKPSQLGIEIAYDFAFCLAESGLIITSGLALGIDGASHRGALAADKPTVAVMGAGLNTIYPHSHKPLVKKILDKGLLVSEYMPDVPPKAENFPQRNRIISGLSVGVLVVEAAQKSGSLITARYALEQGREVFAVPGSIHNPQARGCHYLLRQGAKLVETISDILEEIPALVEGIYTEKYEKLLEKDLFSGVKGLSVDAKTIMNCVGWETTSVESLINRSGLAPEIISANLLSLQLAGCVQAVPGGYIRQQTFQRSPRGMSNIARPEMG